MIYCTVHIIYIYIYIVQINKMKIHKWDYSEIGMAMATYHLQPQYDLVIGENPNASVDLPDLLRRGTFRYVSQIHRANHWNIPHAMLFK